MNSSSARIPTPLPGRSSFRRLTPLVIATLLLAAHPPARAQGEAISVDGTGAVTLGTGLTVKGPATTTGTLLVNTAGGGNIITIGAITLNANGSYPNQGTYLQWNRDGSSGATFLQNVRGGGSGGFRFEEVDDLTGVATQHMGLDGSGNLTVSGSETVGSVTVVGKVGIGTSSPVAKLHVQAQGSGQYAANDNVGQIIISGADPSLRLGFLIDTDNRVGKIEAAQVGAIGLPLVLNPNGGNVGIGTSNPTQGVLEIGSSISADNGKFFYYAKPGTDNGPFSGAQDTSLYASARVVASGFDAFSDERIKNVKGRSDSAADLRNLMQIEITDYTHKDTVVRGDRPQKKVIGQQVEKIFPQAVSILKDVVPDIYQAAQIKAGWITLQTTLKKGERVRLVTEHAAELFEVLETKATGFRVNLPQDGRVFVYGREVDDFRAVDYEAIAMLNVSATQQLKKEKDAEMRALQQGVRALQTENARLSAENTALKHQLTEQATAQATHAKAMEARLARLEQATPPPAAAKVAYRR